MNPAELEAYIRSVAPEYELDPDQCVRQCMAESSLGRNQNPSRVGARGVMQLMPIALRDLAQRFCFVCDPDDPKQCVRGGLTLMHWLKRKYKGDMKKAYAAYNWGAGDIDGAIQIYGELWEAHVPGETLNYVHKILGPDNVIDVPMPHGAFINKHHQIEQIERKAA